MKSTEPNCDDLKFIVADDHPLFRAALTQAVKKVTKRAQVIEACDMAEVQNTIGLHPDTDVVLLDLTMPGVSGYSGLIYLKGQQPALPVIVVSGNDDDSVIRRVIEYGASGFIPKKLSLETMVLAIQSVLDGIIWVPNDVDLTVALVNEAETQLANGIAMLTPQQFRVLVMLMQGLLNKQIAFELSVSEATVKAHVTAILRKLGVQSRTQAVIAARSLDLGEGSVS